MGIRKNKMTMFKRMRWKICRAEEKRVVAVVMVVNKMKT